MPRKSDITRRKLPVVRTDRHAASFVGRADLSRYDLSALRPVRFEFAPKSARLNMRLPENLLTAAKEAAAETGMPYQRFIRQLLERALADQKQP
jgi:predicted DNA binding CopG/RHH family protein